MLQSFKKNENFTPARFDYYNTEDLDYQESRQES